MEDNVSFEDEVNKIPRSSVLCDNRNSNDNGNFDNNLNNNNLPASQIYQEQSRRNTVDAATEFANVFAKGSTKRERDVSWLTRSVTQPNLTCRNDEVRSLATFPSANTQSEESVLRIPDEVGVPQVSTSPSILSSCPSSSYEGLSGGTSSEYLDARSSFSAPVELLSEFLSSLMCRQYEEALSLCQSILKYEPHNATAQEFYPLLLTKIKQSKDDHSSSTDDDTEGDSDELENTDKGINGEAEESEDKKRGKDNKEKVKGTKQPSKTEKRPYQNDSFEHPGDKTSQSTIIGKANGGDQKSLFYPPGNVSSSNSMDFSVEIDSGRESLFTPSDSDLNLDSGDSLLDSLYSSTDSNLNMVRSGSDSLFSSKESGLTLETVIKSMQNVGVEGKQQAIK